MLRTFLCIKHPTSTAYHPQSKEQIERYNRTVVMGLERYVAKNKKDWNSYV